MKKEKIKIIGIGEYGIKAINKFTSEDTKNVELWTLNSDGNKLEVIGGNNSFSPDSAEMFAFTVLRNTEMLFILTDTENKANQEALELLTRYAKKEYISVFNIIFPNKNINKANLMNIIYGSTYIMSSELENELMTNNATQDEIKDVIVETAYVIVDSVLSNFNNKSLLNPLTMENIKELFECNCNKLVFCSIGRATGECRVVKAVKIALGESIKQISADNVYVNICGGSGLIISEIMDAVHYLNGYLYDDTNIMFTTKIDDSMGDDVQVVLIFH